MTCLVSPIYISIGMQNGNNHHNNLLSTESFWCLLVHINISTYEMLYLTVTISLLGDIKEGIRRKVATVLSLVLSACFLFMRRLVFYLGKMVLEGNGNSKPFFNA